MNYLMKDSRYSGNIECLGEYEQAHLFSCGMDDRYIVISRDFTWGRLVTASAIASGRCSVGIRDRVWRLSDDLVDFYKQLFANHLSGIILSD